MRIKQHLVYRNGQRLFRAHKKPLVYENADPVAYKGEVCVCECRCVPLMTRDRVTLTENRVSELKGTEGGH